MSFLITWLVLFGVTLALVYKYGMPALMALKPSRSEFIGWSCCAVAADAFATLVLTFLLVVAHGLLVFFLVMGAVVFGVGYLLNKLYDRHTKS